MSPEVNDGRRVDGVHPFERVLSALRDHGCKIRTLSADSVAASCPAHRDTRPSLRVTRVADLALLHCFAGCSNETIIGALGLKMAELFTGPKSRLPQARIAETYDYRDAVGALLARKVRFIPKDFKWQVPNPAVPGTFLWGLHGTGVGLYNLPALVDAHQVLVTEGERAVDRLTALGFPATCPPNGANTWSPEWSLDLWKLGCVEVIVLADADDVGRRHAERVAAASYALTLPPVAVLDGAIGAVAVDPVGAQPRHPALAVKVLLLPGLPRGGDVVDFLDAGHTAADLRSAIEVAPRWFPGAEAQHRADQRRLLARERQRKCRARKTASEDAQSRGEQHPAAAVQAGEAEP